jgi:hypothetical protein
VGEFHFGRELIDAGVWLCYHARGMRKTGQEPEDGIRESFSFEKDGIDGGF